MPTAGEWPDLSEIDTADNSVVNGGSTWLQSQQHLMILRRVQRRGHEMPRVVARMRDFVKVGA